MAKKMWDKFISFIDALILHSLLLVILFFAIEKPIKPKAALSSAPKFMIQAMAIDENHIQAAIRHRKSGEKDKVLLSQQRKLSQKKQLLEKRVLEKTQRLDDLRQQKKQEQQRLAELKQRQQVETTAIEELKHQQIEQKRLKQAAERLALEAEKQTLIEEIKRQKAEKERLIQETLELKRKAEEVEERERVRQEEAERALLAKEIEQQAEDKRKALLAKEGEIRKKALERARLAEARLIEKKKLIEKVGNDIDNKVKDKWVRPRGYYRGLSCRIAIRLRLDRSISQLKIVSSSGNRVFDSSALRAIRNASPLPIPKKVFDTFKHFEFKFSP